MPTSSSARLSSQASTGTGSRAKSSARPRSSTAKASSAQPPASTPSNKDGATRDRPPLATSEILEKATLPLHGLSARDVLTVWKALGLYLGEQLTKRHRVVAVDRFGVFGYNDAGEAVFLHSSVFLQSNRLKESMTSQGLRGPRALAASADPMSKVNAVEISHEYLQNCGRDVVDKVVAHVVAYIGKLAKQGRNLRLGLAPLGEWTCSGEHVEFKFTLEFQQQMIKSVGMNKDEPARKTTTKKTDGRTPEEMRERGRRSHEQEEPCEAERGLTAQALVAHTTKAGSAGQKPQVSSHNSSGHTSSTSRCAGWSEKASQKAGETRATSDRSNKGSGSGIVARVRAKLLERCGERGLNALQRVLSLLDTSGDGVLSAQELKFGLRDLGIELSASELQQIVKSFDGNGDGVVSLGELLRGMRGSLSDRRRRLIEKAFDCMDHERRGVVSLDDLRANYDVSLLPRVRAGKKTKVQALNEFLRDWETSGEHNNGIPREAFLEYYHNVSASIADDSDFDLLMRQTWHVSPPDSEPESDDEEVKEEPKERQPAFPLPPTRGRAEKEEREAPAQPPQVDEWKYLQSVLLPPRVGVHTQPTLDDVCRRLGVNRVWGDGNETMNTRAFVNALVRLDRQLHSKDAQHLAQYAVQCSGGSSGSGMVSLGAVFQLLMSPSPPVGIAVASGHAPTTGAVIVERIRSRLLQRLQAQTHGQGDPSVPSFLGLNALQRTLRILDTNGDKRLSKDELKLGLRKVGADINFHELDQLFTCLDADHSGCIDTDEFLIAMRGGDEALTKNPRRLALVHKAFDLLDRDRDGSVTLEELSHAYDTSKHPDVLAGRLSAQEALRQFVRQWDTLDKDGVITRREFEVYYRNVSALVDSDDYFELMMRNAWHISGGLGQCANTSNRRVLVTNADGSQSVQEIQNDLGIRASDRDKIHDKLRAQGVYAQAFSSSGAVEDKTQGTDAQTRPPWRREAREAHRPGQPMSKPKEAARPQWGRGKTTESKETLRAGRSPSEFLGSAVESGARLDVVRQQRHEQRQLRERAALLIQAQFRGFKCRKFVDCVRRQMAAEAQRKQRADEEKMPQKRVVARTALKSYYGF